MSQFNATEVVLFGLGGKLGLEIPIERYFLNFKNFDISSFQIDQDVKEQLLLF